MKMPMKKRIGLVLAALLVALLACSFENEIMPTPASEEADYDNIEATPEFPQTRFISNVRGVAVRSEPNTMGEVIGQLEFRDEVEVVSVELGWVEITFGDGTGWLPGVMTVVEPSRRMLEATPAR